MKNNVVRARVSDELKYESEAILSSLGLSMADAITIFLSQVRLHQGMPFEVRIPNKETQAVMLKSAQGQGVARFNSVSDLFEDLEN